MGFLNAMLRALALLGILGAFVKLDPTGWATWFLLGCLLINASKVYEGIFGAAADRCGPSRDELGRARIQPVRRMREDDYAASDEERSRSI